MNPPAAAGPNIRSVGGRRSYAQLSPLERALRDVEIERERANKLARRIESGRRYVEFPEPIEVTIITTMYSCNDDEFASCDNNDVDDALSDLIIQIKVNGYVTDMVPEDIPSFDKIKELLQKPGGYSKYYDEEFDVLLWAQQHLFNRCGHACFTDTELDNPHISDPNEFYHRPCMYTDDHETFGLVAVITNTIKKGIKMDNDVCWLRP